MSEIEELKRKIQYFEDLEEIRDLKARYYEYADIWGKPGRVEEFGALFTETGDWDVGGGCFVGPKAIAKGLYEMSVKCGTAIHYGANPRISIDGDQASGIWHGIVTVTAPGSDEVGWNLGVYEEEYVRTPEGWRYQHVRMRHAVANLDGKGAPSQSSQ